MRLLIIGSLNGDLTAATKIAIDRGAKVTHAPTTESALKDLRSGRGADLVMVDVRIDIAGLIERLEGTVPPTMPLMAPPLTLAEIDRIRQWILEGALNN